MNKEFEVHILNGDGIDKAKKIAADFDTLLESLKTYVPEGREFAIVKTKMEEACFFGKKAIANHPGNQGEAPLAAPPTDPDGPSTKP